MIAALLDHLWQSTLFAAGAGLLALTLRRNAARLRYRLWFAASLKFLIPFAVLSALGESLARFFPESLPRAILVLQPAAQRLSAPAQALVAQQSPPVALAPLLAAAWLLGCALVLGVRLVRWSRLRAILREARDLVLPGVLAGAWPVKVKASASLLEPGLVGIWRPVVVLPQGLMARLSGAERDCILAHEFGHLVRRDNVTAAVHMLVEALFWFYPPVWLIGARLISERERACDEGVLAAGHDPEAYSSGILKVCKFCIRSPLACAPGASGADLSGRVRQIMAGEPVRSLSCAQRLLLASATLLVLGLPVAGGFLDTPLLNTPLAAAVQQRVAAVRSQVTAGLVQVAAAANQISAPRPAKLRHLSRPRAPAPQALAPSQATAALSGQAAAPVQAISATQTGTASDLDWAVASTSAPEDDYPTGEGALVDITCRTPRPLPDGRPGPKLCMHNHYWALLRSAGLELTADGKNTFDATRRS